MRKLLILSPLLFLCGWIAVAKAATCGYDGCTGGKDGVINVHVVPHTHDDVGWLKTVDQYYEGWAQYQKAGVRWILDSVVKELEKDSARRFIYVEMAFFSQWWKEQTEEKQNSVRKLVAEGRLEFINGGWCMNDEAATHYNDIIDQMTWGMRFLNDTFGECGRPRIGWQIDPFGHSREQSNLFALMGFDGVFFGRIDWVDRSNRKEKKQMEMLWQTSNSLGERGSIFTGIFYDHYSAPGGFCFDVLCRDTPFVDNPKSIEYNVPQRVNELVDHIVKKANAYATNHIMLTMGDDFNYMTADMNFKNMDKMIKYTNQLNGTTVNLFYSTPSCYVKALNDAGIKANIKWPVKTDDFFPYSNDPHAYWTGYFTSRSAYKGTVRKTSTYLQTCKQLRSLSGIGTDNQDRIDDLRRKMGEAQHHDAVAGTEKDHVDQDYRLRLHESTVGCQQDTAESLDQILRIGNQPLPPQKFCLQLNVTQCEATESGSTFVVTAYNPRSQEETAYIRLPVQGPATFTVLDPAGSELASQLVPVVDSAVPASATYELVFQAARLPPLGHKSFYIVKSRTGFLADRQLTRVSKPKAQPTTITNGKVLVSFDGNGMMDGISVDGQNVPLTQNLMWYKAMPAGNSGNTFEDRASGAYVFRPDGTDSMPIATQTSNFYVLTGPVVQEVHQKFSDWASQVVRLYKGQSHVEIEWTVGPIPIEDGIGKEIINRVETSVPSRGMFYTDSNGRQTLQRRRDYRLTWPLDISEPVSENYYPINSHIYLTDDAVAPAMMVAMVNDRSQGGTSLRDGSLELMVHRRLLYDDRFGVGQPLNETGEDGRGLIVRGSHFLLVNPRLSGQHPMSLIRPLVQMATTQPQLSFAETDLSFTNWKRNFHMEKSGLRQPLPDNINILTLEPWKDGTHLLRLEHVVDVGEDPNLSEPVTLTLDDLFADYTITRAEETTLGANQWASDSNRLKWTTTSSMDIPKMNPSGKISIQLQPMDIKTFIITLTAN